MKSRIVGALALGVLVAACGTDPQERVTGGAAAGAATGAGVGALGGPPGVLAGAAIGAGAGAATGAMTEPSDVNLGRPVWNDPDVRVPGRGAASSTRGSGIASSDTRSLQRALNARGYDAGPVDGVYGQRTRQAVMDWQRANNQQATGRPSSQMMAGLRVGGDSATGQTDPNRASMGGGMVTSQATDTRPRDAAGHPIGSPGPGVPPGSTNQTGAPTGASMGPGQSSGGGTTLQSPAGVLRDPAGHTMGAPSQGSGEGPGSNNTPGSTTNPR